MIFTTARRWATASNEMHRGKFEIVRIIHQNGKVVWKTACKTQYNAASPLIDGSTVVFAGPAQGQTTAYKIEKSGDTFKATQTWNATVGTAYNTPVRKDGFLYGLVAAGGGGMRGGTGTYACLNAANGQVAWNDTASPSSSSGRRLRASAMAVCMASVASLGLEVVGAK